MSRTPPLLSPSGPDRYASALPSRVWTSIVSLGMARGTLRGMPSQTARRVSESEHRSRPWRIHDIAPDFELEDVWALPTPGGPGDFPRLVAVATRFDPGGG